MTSSMTLQGASSSSSSSSTSPRPYDVFLSFRGKDTRHNFTTYLCKTLREKGIYTYMDDKLRMGDEIGPELLKAINESRIAIVVLSENYASSTWCLHELERILECMETNQQIVMPVFYEVDPSDVRHLKKSFGEALVKHESRNTEDSTVNHWKAALQKVADLSGRHLRKGNEFDVMDQIVQEVISKMAKLIPILDVAKYPVGIESRVKQINALLRIEMNDRRMVGIFGPGGIGKTTIAKAVFNSIAHQFKGKCFLKNVRETSKRDGLASLQEKLLYEILGDSSLKVHSVDRGVNVIKERLCNKNILLVLDDVDDLTQLENLSRECGWFGLGSRIIITTRDESLLAKHGVDLRHKMNDLDDNEAFQLFSRHAFLSDKPNEDFMDLTKSALCYAGGNPLALVVVGSNLSTEDKSHWKSELKKYERNPLRNIYEILKISYDGLEENEKNIFLDIACFFKGEDAKYVTHILSSCNFYPDSGIKVLINKSLITNDMGNLVMHDLVQGMGRQIVHEESPNKPGKRSRLWYYEDVRYVLEENMGTNKIEGILLDLPKRDLRTYLSSKTFEKMTSLRLFINHNACFSASPRYLSNELRVLDWPGCPLQSFPSKFYGNKLVVLKIHNSPLKLLKDGFKDFQNLRIMKFRQCKFITEIPDISSSPNLEVLEVELCESLVKVHNSVGFLDKLTTLHFIQCSNLITLPKILKLRSLETLRFCYCARLQNIPEIGCKMECLRKLTVCYIAIKEVPSSIVYFTRLSDLCIIGCKNLTRLPISLQLQHPNILRHERRSKAVELPTKVRDERESMLSVVSTEESETSSSTKLFASPPPADACIFYDGSSSTAFPELTFLSIEKCTGLVKPEFIMTLDRFSNLHGLYLSKTDIVRLPACIKRFVGLKYLGLEDCKQLKEIPELPPNIKFIKANGCVSLESFPDLSKTLQFSTSRVGEEIWIDLSGCYKLAENIGNQVENTLLDQGLYNDYFDGGIVFPGNTLPAWFSHRKESSYGNSCAIHINGLSNLDEIKGIAVCAVFGPSPDVPNTKDIVAFCFAISSEGIEIGTRRRCLTLQGSNHVLLEYLVLEPFVLKEDNLQVEVLMSSELFIKSCGVHMIYKHVENAKDHPSLTHVDFNFCDEIEYFHSSTSEDEGDEESENTECSAEEDDCDKIERVLDGIQPS